MMTRVLGFRLSHRTFPYYTFVRSRSVNFCRHVSTFNYFSSDAVRWPGSHVAQPNWWYRIEDSINVDSHLQARTRGHAKKDCIENIDVADMLTTPLYRKQRRIIGDRRHRLTYATRLECKTIDSPGVLFTRYYSLMWRENSIIIRSQVFARAIKFHASAVKIERKFCFNWFLFSLFWLFNLTIIFKTHDTCVLELSSIYKLLLCIICLVIMFAA